MGLLIRFGSAPFNKDDVVDRLFNKHDGTGNRSVRKGVSFLENDADGIIEMFHCKEWWRWLDHQIKPFITPALVQKINKRQLLETESTYGILPEICTEGVYRRLAPREALLAELKEKIPLVAETEDWHAQAKQEILSVIAAAEQCLATYGNRAILLTE